MDEQGDVIPPLAQRGEADGEDVEAVVEVLAKCLLLDRPEQVAAGGGDDADVHADRGGTAHAVELALLQHSEQLRLRFRRELADLVEEDAPTVRELESAQPPGDGAAEGALFMAEQLALHETGRQGGAVDPDERFVFPLARRVDGAGDQFFACAGFAGDEHRGVGGFHQGGAPADNLLVIMDRFDLLLEVQVMLLEARLFALREDPVRDVDKERAAGLHGCVLAAAGLHPDIDPQGPAVLAAEFQLPPRDRLAGQMLAVNFHTPLFPGRRIGHEGVDRCAHEFVDGITEHLRQMAVAALDPPVGADDQIGIGRVLIKIAIASLTLPEALFGPHPLPFGGGPGGEDAEDE